MDPEVGLELLVGEVQLGVRTRGHLVAPLLEDRAQILAADAGDVEGAISGVVVGEVLATLLEDRLDLGRVRRNADACSAR